MPPFFQMRFHSILDRAYWNGVKARYSSSDLQALDDRCEKIPERFQPASAADYLAAKRNNDRSVIDRYRSYSLHQLSALAIRRCLLGAEQDDRLLNWIFGIISEPTWVLSAHLPGQDLPQFGLACLDLTSCGMTAMLAEMLEVLKPWIDTQSETLTGSIVAEIDRRTLTPYGEGFKVWWEKPKATNWLGVCAGNILAACEALGALGHPRPAARLRAIKGLDWFLKAGFTEHGECDEGMGYWAYGVGEACMGLSRLGKRELEENFDLERFHVIASYPQATHLFGDSFFSGNDSAMTCGMNAQFIPWLASLFQDRWLGGWVARSDRKPGFGLGFSGWLRALEVPDDWEEERNEEKADAQKDGPRYLQDQQTGIVRATTLHGELVVCMSGGNNAERHNHNDLGHFVAALDGKFIIPDLHPPDYTVDYFSPNRYKYESASSRGHCCPLINGWDQREGAEAAGKLIEWSSSGDTAHVNLDLTAAYPDEAGLLRWTRGLDWRNRKADISIIDAFMAKSPGATIVHRIWSFELPVLERNGGGSESMILTLGLLTCEISPAPQAHEFTAHDPKEFGIGSYCPGVKLHRIDLAYRTDGKGDLHIRTRFS